MKFVLDMLVTTFFMYLQQNSLIVHTQLTFTCSKSTIETLEKAVKGVSIVDFEQVNNNWKGYEKA